MSSQLKTTTKRVRYMLENHPSTRNSDITLTVMLWKKFFPDSLMKAEDGQYYVKVTDLMEIDREDHIKRIRAKIQNEEHLFPPTKEAIAKKRNWNIDVWRKHLGYPAV